jgi:hypothetical protein
MTQGGDCTFKEKDNAVWNSILNWTEKYNVYTTFDLILWAVREKLYVMFCNEK